MRNTVLLLVILLILMIILISCEYETRYSIEIVNQLGVPVDIYIDGEFCGTAEPSNENLTSLFIDIEPGIHDLEAKAEEYEIAPIYENLDVERDIKWTIELATGVDEEL